MGTDKPLNSPPISAPSTAPPGRVPPRPNRSSTANVARDPKFDAPADVDPAPEPDNDPADDHTPPLDDVEDAKYLDEDDPRRVEIEEFQEGEES